MWVLIILSKYFYKFFCFVFRKLLVCYGMNKELKMWKVVFKLDHINGFFLRVIFNDLIKALIKWIRESDWIVKFKRKVTGVHSN